MGTKPLSVQLLSSNHECGSLIMRVDGREYEYFLLGDLQSHYVRYREMLNKGAHGKVLNEIKRRAVRCEPL